MSVAKIWDSIVDFLTKKVDFLFDLPVWVIGAAGLGLIAVIIIVAVVVCKRKKTSKKATKKAKSKTSKASKSKDSSLSNSLNVNERDDSFLSAFKADETQSESVGQSHDDGEIEYIQEPVKETAAQKAAEVEKEPVKEPVAKPKEAAAQPVKEVSAQPAKEAPAQPAKERVKKEPVKTEATAKKESAKPEAVAKKEPAKTEPAAKKEAVKAETVKADTATAKKEPAKTEKTVKTETVKADAITTKKEPVKAETTKKEPAKKETVKEDAAAAVDEQNKGKYAVYIDGDGCRFALQASNGVNVFESGIYSTAASCKAAITTFKNNVQKGMFEVKKLDSGEWTYLIKRTNGSYEGKRYSTEAQAKAGIASVQKFYSTSLIKQIATIS